MQWGSAKSDEQFLLHLETKEGARRAAEEAESAFKRSVKTECSIRWGSRKAMIDRVLKQQEAIVQVLLNVWKVRHLTPSWQDIDVLDAINKSLSPLVEFTDALSGKKVCHFKPILHLFKNDTDLTKTSNDKHINTQLVDMASTLDPDPEL